MPGTGGNWQSKLEERAKKKALQDFSRSAKRILDYTKRRKTDDPLSIPKKGFLLEKSSHNSHWINMKNLNRQNRYDERITRRSKEKYSTLQNENTIIHSIPEEEPYVFKDIRKPWPRTLESLIPEDQHERLQSNNDYAVLQLAFSMALHAHQEKLARTEQEKLQEALLLSIRDASPASSWQIVGGSEHSMSTAAWQEVGESEVGGSELSVPVSLNRWVDVAPEVSPDDSKNEDVTGSASAGTEQSWPFIES